MVLDACGDGSLSGTGAVEHDACPVSLQENVLISMDIGQVPAVGIQNPAALFRRGGKGGDRLFPASHP